MARPKNVVHLDALIKSQVEARRALIAQHELTAQALQRDLEAFLKEKAHVDVNNGHWEYDPINGTLTRLPEHQGAPHDAEG